jgi:hypothetical protein
VNAAGYASLSLTPENPGSLSSVGATAGVGYTLSRTLQLNAGVRVAWQEYQGAKVATVMPLTAAVYCGLSWGKSVPLNHH